MCVYYSCIYILTCICCHVPESEGEKWFYPSSHLSLLSSVQIKGKIKTRKKISRKGMAEPKILVSSFIYIWRLSFCDFICCWSHSRTVSEVFSFYALNIGLKPSKYVLFHKCVLVWVLGGGQRREVGMSSPNYLLFTARMSNLNILNFPPPRFIC